MPTTSTFRSRHSRRIDWSSGISWRHGAHQVAQKLIINDLPRQVAMEVGLPVRSPNENSGSRSGIFGRICPPGASAVPTPKSKGASKAPAVGGLAAPAGTGTPATGAPPEWMGTAARFGAWLLEYTRRPTQTPNNITNNPPARRSARGFMRPECRDGGPFAA